MYEKINEIGKDKFIQNHNAEGANYSSIMTSVLVVLNKKNEQKFRQGYLSFLSEHNRNDMDNWRKREENRLK